MARIYLFSIKIRKELRITSDELRVKKYIFLYSFVNLGFEIQLPQGEFLLYYFMMDIL